MGFIPPLTGKDFKVNLQHLGFTTYLHLRLIYHKSLHYGCYGCVLLKHEDDDARMAVNTL